MNWLQSFTSIMILWKPELKTFKCMTTCRTPLIHNLEIKDIKINYNWFSSVHLTQLPHRFVSLGPLKCCIELSRFIISKAQERFCSKSFLYFFIGLHINQFKQKERKFAHVFMVYDILHFLISTKSWSHLCHRISRKL